MNEIIERLENLKIKNAAIYQKQISNNFKFEVCTMENYIEWFENQEK